MNNRKVISVRYLNSDVEHPLSRPHKLQRITDKDGKVHYYTMNSRLRSEFEIDPAKFVTKWEKTFPQQKVSTKVESIWEVIRVKFKPAGERTKFTRPARIFKITTGDQITYAPKGVKGTIKRLNSDDFITEWPRAGKTPTERPLRKYCDESLKKMVHTIDQDGTTHCYTIEDIRVIRERNFSAKDIDMVSKNLSITRAEARKLLEENGGHKHKIYVKKNTKGIKIDGKWKTNIPGEKSDEAKKNMAVHKKQNQLGRSRHKRTTSISHMKKQKRTGRF